MGWSFAFRSELRLADQRERLVRAGQELPVVAEEGLFVELDLQVLADLERDGLVLCLQIGIAACRSARASGESRAGAPSCSRRRAFRRVGSPGTGRPGAGWVGPLPSDRNCGLPISESVW